MPHNHVPEVFNPEYAHMRLILRKSDIKTMKIEIKLYHKEN